MFKYKPSFIPTNFVLIGAGGTGGRLIPLLAQFLKTATWIQNPRIYVIDNDIVEEKNLVRQNFIKLDVGKPKAVVVAERYSKAFDINIVPIVEKVEHIRTSGKVIYLDQVNHASAGVVRLRLDQIQNAIIVMCVDSIKSRLDVLSHILTSGINKNLLILDAGNENDFGQVVLFNDVIFAPTVAYATREQVKALPIEGLGIPFDVAIPYIPVPIAFYEDMKEVDTKSCADLDQTLAINATMATCMMGLIQSIVYDKPIPFHKVNISLLDGAIPELMTIKTVEDAMFSTAPYRSGHKVSKVILPFTADLGKMLSSIEVKMKEFKGGESNQEKSKKVVKKEVKAVADVAPAVDAV